MKNHINLKMPHRLNRKYYKQLYANEFGNLEKHGQIPRKIC